MALLLLQGCTKEKAEALKAAAELFRSQATEALDQVRTVLRGNVQMPPIETSKIAADLEQPDFSSDDLAFLLSEGQVEDSESKSLDQRIDKIETHYQAFVAMFQSLDKGSYLAGNAVEKAQKHAVNLTVQMVTLARMLDQGTIPVKLNARRILLIEKIQQHNRIPDATIKKSHLEGAAKEILALRREEAAVKDRAISRCVQAAKTGEAVLRMIKDYKRLKVQDILDQFKKSAAFVSEVTGNKLNAGALIEKATLIEDSMRSDPYWGTLLDVEVDMNNTKKGENHGQ